MDNEKPKLLQAAEEEMGDFIDALENEKPKLLKLAEEEMGDFIDALEIEDLELIKDLLRFEILPSCREAAFNAIAMARPGRAFIAMRFPLLVLSRDDVENY